MVGHQARHGALENSEDLVDLFNVGSGEPAHVVAPAAVADNQPVPLQLQKGFTDRCATDAHALRKNLLVDSFARSKVTAAELLFE